MFLGLLVVVGVVGLVFNYFQKRRGSVGVPGISQTNEEVASKGDYIVKKGDSLWKIAFRTYGVGYSWVEIWKENNIEDPDRLLIGQKLKLPDLTVVRADSYVVVGGDSLWKISVKVYGDGFRWGELWRANRVLIPDPNLIYGGTRLLVPMLK